MIVGHGDIASAIDDRVDFLFFASGVSNSREERSSEYQREIDLLLKQDKKKHLVYFSSLCVFYDDSRYAFHKKYMENLVKEKFKNYTIMRLGNITWGTNPHTLINFFKMQKKYGVALEVQDTYRFIVDKDEFNYWINKIPKWSCEMNVPGRRMKVIDIVKEYV